MRAILIPITMRVIQGSPSPSSTATALTVLDCFTHRQVYDCPGSKIRKIKASKANCCSGSSGQNSQQTRANLSVLVFSVSFTRDISKSCWSGRNRVHLSTVLLDWIFWLRAVQVLCIPRKAHRPHVFRAHRTIEAADKPCSKEEAGHFPNQPSLVGLASTQLMALMAMSPPFLVPPSCWLQPICS